MREDVKLTILRFLNELDAKGLRFQFETLSPWGSGELLWLEPRELFDFHADEVAFVAREYGGTKEQYLTWIADGMSVRCCAKTKKGRQCRFSVSGFEQAAFATWLKEQSQANFCFIHQDR